METRVIGLIRPENADYTDVLSWAGLNGGIQAIPVLSVLKVIGFVTSGLLIGVGLGAMGTVITANRTAARELTKERTRVKEEVESKPRPPKSKILFHYTNAAAAQQIFATGELRSFRRGTFGFGNYATDQAGWLAVEIMASSRLTEIIFGRNIPSNYAETIWFVAFIENPRDPFRKVAPFIYKSDTQVTDITPLYIGPTLLGEH